MTTQIIELREQDADTNHGNGDWSMSLNYSKDLTLNDGDTLAIKNVFIDTLSQSNQKINIPQEITYEIEFYYYYIYSRQDGLTGITTGSQQPLPPIDGEPWIVCTNGGDDPITLWTIYAITLLGTRIEPANGYVQVQYYDKNGVQQSTKVGPYNGTDTNPGITVDCNIIYDKSKPLVLKPTSPEFNSSRVSISERPLDGKIQLQAHTSKFTGTFPPGSYSPQQLVVELNRELQKALVGGEKNQIYENPFLISKSSIGTDVYLCKYDGSMAMEVTGNLLFGANFVDFEFIDTTNQFSINYSHTPFYQAPQGSAPAQPAVGFLNLDTTNFLTVNKNSGILFQSLTSTFADGTEAHLWDTILGFNLQSLCLGHTNNGRITINGVVTEMIKTNNNLVDGLNTTGGFIPLTAQVNLLSNTWYEAANPYAGDFLSTSTDTFNILGTQQTQSNTEFDYGYFLVSLDANFKSKYLAKSVKENIMAIVSRYYELNSFTSATDPGMTYTHIGDPITLSDFHIKVLNPTKQVASNLGDRSCIFLEIIRK